AAGARPVAGRARRGRAAGDEGADAAGVRLIAGLALSVAGAIAAHAVGAEGALALGVLRAGLAVREQASAVGWPAVRWPAVFASAVARPAVEPGVEPAVALAAVHRVARQVRAVEEERAAAHRQRETAHPCSTSDHRAPPTNTPAPSAVA